MSVSLIAVFIPIPLQWATSSAASSREFRGPLSWRSLSLLGRRCTLTTHDVRASLLQKDSLKKENRFSRLRKTSSIRSRRLRAQLSAGRCAIR
jgi:hypothetical protein